MSVRGQLKGMPRCGRAQARRDASRASELLFGADVARVAAEEAAGAVVAGGRAARDAGVLLAARAFLAQDRVVARADRQVIGRRVDQAALAHDLALADAGLDRAEAA